MNVTPIIYVVYSNTDYLPILRIQSDYIAKYSNKILFINNNSTLDLIDIYSKYDNVIFYNNNTPYATRLFDCLTQLSYSHILLIHHIDILLYSDEEILNKLLHTMSVHNIDRIDLKYTSDTISPNNIEFSDSISLIQQKDIGKYIYNVNPSIWKRESFLSILSKFKHCGYRDVEGLDMQIFCSNYNIYKIHSPMFVRCGYFECVDFFKFLHISHGGKLLRLNDSRTTIYGQSYDDIYDEYKTIVDKYNLKHSEKTNT